MLKICIVCFRFQLENFNRQPWRYVFEIAKGINNNFVDVNVISNGEKSESKFLDGICVRYVRASDRSLHASPDTLKVLLEEDPDVIIMLIGLLDLLRKKPSIGKPTIAILTSPLYGVGGLLRLGPCELIIHARLIYLHFFSALVPRFLLKRGARFYNHFIVLSDRNRTRLSRCGINPEKISVVKPGILNSDLVVPHSSEVQNVRDRICSAGSPVILYYGSPLTLRGTDTLLQALTQVSVPTHLVLLSRIDDVSSIEEVHMLERMIENYGLANRVVINASIADHHEIKNFLCAADIICLPFKLVISDVPITILEAMALGKPVISTNLDGIPELLSERGVIVRPNKSDELATMLARLLMIRGYALRLGELARNFMLDYPRWEDQSREVLTIIEGVSGHRN